MGKKLELAVMGATILSLVLASGCATQSSTTASSTDAAIDGSARVAELEGFLREREAQLEERERELAQLRTTSGAPAAVSSPPPSLASGELFPPNAKPGECYARVFVPAEYRSVSERVLKREASARLEVVPVKYGTGEERVLVKEASTRIETIPAVLGWAEEQVLVRPASKRLEVVPAKYGWDEERILDRPEHTVWKKGRGPIERVDHGTGEIMCLVTVPATYKTVRKRVLKSPAATREIEIPAQYKTVKKRVVKTPPSTRTIEIPAEYKTIKTRTVVSPPSEKRIEIPAEYANVTRRELVKDGALDWREILCETNMSGGLVRRVQQALKTAGHSPGSIDGAYGADTLRAVKSYQKAKNLPSGHLTLATLKSLGVQP